MDWDWLIDIGKEIAPAVITGGAGYLINKNATDSAVESQTAAADKALALAERMYNQSREDLAPYRQTGNAANAKLSSLMGLNPVDTNGARAKLMADHPALFRASQPATPTATGGAGSGGGFDGMTQDVRESMVRNSIGGGMPSMYLNKNQVRDRDNLEYLKSKDGTTNKYSGETVNYDDWLNQRLAMQNSGASGQLIPQANQQYRDAQGKAAVSESAARFDPTRSLFERLAPMLAIAAMTGGAGLVEGLPTAALNSIKGVTSGAKMLAGK